MPQVEVAVLWCLTVTFDLLRNANLFMSAQTVNKVLVNVGHLRDLSRSLNCLFPFVRNDDKLL